MAEKKDPKKTHGGKMFSGTAAADFAKAKAKVEEAVGRRGRITTALKKATES
tara:strand:+ start:622 stop:777 length:156 start_codon:yes stop_codon:yes gene_type:complete